jgi:predicted Abi (CAAX) family protease
MKTTTVSQLVGDLSRFPDADQWLILGFTSLMVVAFSFWVGFAVVLVTRTVLTAVLAGVIYRLRSRGIVHQRKLVDGGIVQHATA